MTVLLNEGLLEKQGIDEAGTERIIALHEDLGYMFEMMELLDPSDPSDIISLKEWAAKVEEQEFKLQEAWGFPLSREHHSWWYRVPHCCCPRLDNMDNFGTDYRITAGNCPIHGFKSPA